MDIYIYARENIVFTCTYIHVYKYTYTCADLHIPYMCPSLALAQAHVRYRHLRTCMYLFICRTVGVYMCKYICTYRCISIYTFIYIYLHTYVYIHTNVYIHTHIHVYVSLCLEIRVSLHVYVFIVEAGFAVCAMFIISFHVDLLFRALPR